MLCNEIYHCTTNKSFTILKVIKIFKNSLETPRKVSYMTHINVEFLMSITYKCRVGKRKGDYLNQWSLFFFLVYFNVQKKKSNNYFLIFQFSKIKLNINSFYKNLKT